MCIRDRPNDTDEDKSLQEKINYLAKSLNINPSTIKVIDTDKGKALVYLSLIHIFFYFLIFS